MSDIFPVVKCIIDTLDRTLYASREVGDLVDSGEYILNTALYYAFGFVSGTYVNFGKIPSYLDDTAEICKEFYITPAKPEPVEEYVKEVLGISTRYLGKRMQLPYIGGHSTSQWNARSHRYAVKNWKANELPKSLKGKNLPKFGRERVLDQQNLLTAYIIPYESDADSITSRIPRYVRIGKKRSKARVKTRVVDGKIEEGEFTTNHPFGIYDYDGVPLGDLISVRMRPAPLIIQGRYRGKFVRISQADENESVILPYKLELLKGKR
ncbi:type I-D CRISPR-associated protein Cas5/Csc1 [Candidatus Methanocrinis natronophilus]|uniref:Type I-D CRISPR-associated protein Cas5/Csc1 n=1 Tax=Candidatus Methanocrinis natronophilus TaxID=3033396 RepID=A0ABT5X645_9EURY|nr:type I-D CRISPR-associated protein Cas5/Csc1 [Candidatus Methanocrinis natronophilus]MDF0590156.1 type I-D CRISPR-associated protein Cas5/Csc1 [Candidatus Methanocrinis natronophilus]